MFDIGWQELFIVGLLALIVVGPKDLPRVIRTVSGVIRKVKGMAREFQSGLDDVVRESELADMRKELEAQSQEIDSNFSKELDPTGDLTGDLDFSDEQRELEQAISSDDTPAAHYEPEDPAIADTTDRAVDTGPEIIAETPVVDDTKKDG